MWHGLYGVSGTKYCTNLFTLSFKPSTVEANMYKNLLPMSAVLE